MSGLSARRRTALCQRSTLSQLTDGAAPRIRNQMMNIASSRADAQAHGITFYQGRPCQAGHEGIRYAANKACRDCVQLAGKGRPRSGYRDPETSRAWKAANPDKVREERARRKVIRAERARMAAEERRRQLLQAALII